MTANQEQSVIKPRLYGDFRRVDGIFTPNHAYIALSRPVGERFVGMDIVDSPPVVGISNDAQKEKLLDMPLYLKAAKEQLMTVFSQNLLAAVRLDGGRLANQAPKAVRITWPPQLRRRCAGLGWGRVRTRPSDGHVQCTERTAIPCRKHSVSSIGTPPEVPTLSFPDTVPPFGRAACRKKPKCQLHPTQSLSLRAKPSVVA